MKYIAMGLVLFPVISLADSISSIPTNINDVPVFYGFLNENPKYHDAAFKAQEAFFIQTGVTPAYNKVKSYATDKATNSVTTFIDKDTPFNSKELFTVVGTAYTIGVKKQITKSFKNPFLPWMNNTVTLSQQSQSVGVNIPF